MTSHLFSVANASLEAGLCPLPAIRAEKRPALKQWKQYRERLPTKTEIGAWFANGHDGICILCGEISGNAEMLDFDCGGELFDAWARRIPAELLARLVIETTQRGGKHVFYRSEEPVCGNMKLAQRLGSDGKVITLIETRGEGGLFLCAPTAGYHVLQGDLSAPPTLTESERNALLMAAWELNEYLPPPLNETRLCVQPGGKDAPMSYGVRPGDDFNERGDVRRVLERAGWVCARPGENEYWRRPGKSAGWSASLKDRVFYVFSANASPFEPNRAYAPFSVYALLSHNGDYEAAARALRVEGYGNEPVESVDLSVMLDASLPATTPTTQPGAAREASLIQSATIDIQTFAETPEREVAWIWQGVIPRSMLSLIGGKQGLGKSFLVCDIAARVSTGRPMPAGLANAPGNVLLLAREDDASSVLLPRLKAAKADLNRVWWSLLANAKTNALLDLTKHVGLLARTLAEKRIDLVVVDTFASFAPVGTDSNAAQDVRLLLDALTWLARSTDTAVVVVAHLRKSGQGDGDPMDAIAGSHQMTAGVRVASMLEKGAIDGERWFRVVKSNLGRIDERGWTWRFAWPDPFTEGASEMPYLEWAVAGDEYDSIAQGRTTIGCNSQAVRLALYDLLATGPRLRRNAYGLVAATLRKTHPHVRIDDVALVIEELIHNGDDGVEIWDGARGAKMIGLPGSRPESAEDKALRLARENPGMSVRELRSQAGCGMRVASEALRAVRSGVRDDKEATR